MTHTPPPFNFWISLRDIDRLSFLISGGDDFTSPATRLSHLCPWGTAAEVTAAGGGDSVRRPAAEIADWLVSALTVNEVMYPTPPSLAASYLMNSGSHHYQHQHHYHSKYLSSHASERLIDERSPPPSPPGNTLAAKSTSNAASTSSPPPSSPLSNAGELAGNSSSSPRSSSSSGGLSPPQPPRTDDSGGAGLEMGSGGGGGRNTAARKSSSGLSVPSGLIDVDDKTLEAPRQSVEFAWSPSAVVQLPRQMARQEREPQENEQKQQKQSQAPDKPLLSFTASPRVVNFVARHTVIAREYPPPSPSEVASSEMPTTNGAPLRDLHVNHCHDAHLYLLEPYRFATVFGCTDCTIVVGAVKGMLRVVGCERVQVIAACRRLYISSCVDSIFPVFSASHPILAGDNRACQFAPYNTAYVCTLTFIACLEHALTLDSCTLNNGHRYPDLIAHLQATGLPTASPPAVNYWNR